MVWVLGSGSLKALNYLGGAFTFCYTLGNVFGFCSPSTGSIKIEALDMYKYTFNPGVCSK